MVDIFTFWRPMALMSPMTQGRGMTAADGAGGGVGVQVPVDRPGRAGAAVEAWTPEADPVETEGRRVVVDRSTDGAAVETAGALVDEVVEIAGGGAVGAVPEEGIWAEAEEESAAAARMAIRSLFTGRLSIPNRFPGRGLEGIEDGHSLYRIS